MLWDLEPVYYRVLAYPSGDRGVARRRLAELQLLGVEELLFEGPVELWGVRVVAKGTTSIVLKGIALGSVVAVKARRLDSNRPSLLREAEMLKLANSVGVGPRLLAASRNFLVWPFVEGTPIEEWLLEARPSELRRVVRDLLRQAAALDEMGLAHKELSRLRGHVLVAPGPRPVIFDFESASTSSSKSNVTQLAQALFLRRSPLCERVRDAFSAAREEVIEALRAYKRSGSLRPLEELGLL